MKNCYKVVRWIDGKLWVNYCVSLEDAMNTFYSYLYSADLNAGNMFPDLVLDPENNVVTDGKEFVKTVSNEERDRLNRMTIRDLESVDLI